MNWITTGSNFNQAERISKGHQYYLTVIFLCSTLLFWGDFGKTIEEDFGIIVIPFLIVISYVLFARKRFFPWKNFILAFTIVLFFLLSIMLVGGGIGSLVNNISAVLYVFFFFNLEFTKGEYRYFTKLILAFQIYLGVYCLFFTLDNGYVGIYNSNTIGIQILLNLIYINMHFRFNRKYVAIFINVISIFLIFYTRSRTSLIAGIVVVLFILINRRKMISAWLMKTGFWLVSFIGAYYPVLYVTLYKDTENDFLQNLNLLSILYFNKSIFTGREHIWVEAVDRMNESSMDLLLGIGSHYMIGDSNFHSSYFTIVICGGLMAYICFIWFLYCFFKKGDFATREIQRSRLLYLAMMIIGINESTLFSGHFAIMSYMLLCTSKSFKISGGIR